MVSGGAAAGQLFRGEGGQRSGDGRSQMGISLNAGTKVVVMTCDAFSSFWVRPVRARPG